jgi:hypothetical protein
VKEMIVVDTSGSGRELTQDVNVIRIARMSDVEIDKAIHEVTIASEILERDTIYGMKTNVKLHRSVHIAVISKTDTIKKIINVLSLGEVVLGGGGPHPRCPTYGKRHQVWLDQ